MLQADVARFYSGHRRRIVKLCYYVISVSCVKNWENLKQDQEASVPLILRMAEPVEAASYSFNDPTTVVHSHKQMNK